MEKRAIQTIEDIRQMVDTFYAEIRGDALLGLELTKAFAGVSLSKTIER